MNSYIRLLFLLYALNPIHGNADTDVVVVVVVIVVGVRIII